VKPGSGRRFIVVCQERRVPLPEGEFLVGRGIGCHIRFNAANVSRQHLRLRVSSDRLLAENLSTTSGTLLNDQRLAGTCSLDHGDKLTLGLRSFLQIEVEDDEAAFPAEPTPAPQDAFGDEEATRPHFDQLPGAGEQHASIEYHTCPSCRTRVDFGESLCARCGYAWSPQHPSAVTQRVTMKDMLGPADAAAAAARPWMPPTQIPVVYASEELMIDAIVTDLRIDGAFIPSELLDTKGTTCELTLLPDGIHALTVTGVVASASATTDAGGAAGFEVRFVDVPDSARVWIDRWLAARRQA
jgi:hypothetical protein